MKYLVIIASDREGAGVVERVLNTAESFLSTIAGPVARAELGEFRRHRRGDEILTRLVAMHVGEVQGEDSAKALEAVLRQTARAAGAKGLDVQVLARAED